MTGNKNAGLEATGVRVGCGLGARRLTVTVSESFDVILVWAEVVRLAELMMGGLPRHGHSDKKRRQSLYLIAVSFISKLQIIII